jgi:hypothetical protein
MITGVHALIYTKDPDQARPVVPGLYNVTKRLS